MFTVFIWFLLPMLNIIFGSVFINTPICQKTSNTTITTNSGNSTNSTNTYINRVEEISPTVNLSIWLIVNGVFWLVLLLCSVLYFVIKKEKNKDTCLEQTKGTYMIIFPITVILFITFLFCWMIIGTVSFWRDCGDNVNKTISGCMYFTLVSELVYVVINVFWLLKKFFWGVMEMCGY